MLGSSDNSSNGCELVADTVHVAVTKDKCNPGYDMHPLWAAWSVAIYK